MNNRFLVNDLSVGISKIELDKSQLSITSKDGECFFYHVVYYSWKEINSLKIGEIKNINFNENCFSINTEGLSALVWPEVLTIERLDETKYKVTSKTTNYVNNIIWMNNKNNIVDPVKSIETVICYDTNDASNGSIIYNF